MDDAFVQPPEHQPLAPVPEATGVPVIDLSLLADTPPPPGAVDALAAEVGAACRDWGFFVAVGHGVPEATAARAVEAGRAFFALRPERKAAVRRTERAPLGYYDAEHTRNVRDWKEVFDIFPRELPPAASADSELVFVNKWPEDGDLPGFRLALTPPLASLSLNLNALCVS
jgi:isopenicillin N synthase-like dioxygenase